MHTDANTYNQIEQMYNSATNAQEMASAFYEDRMYIKNNDPNSPFYHILNHKSDEKISRECELLADCLKDSKTGEHLKPISRYRYFDLMSRLDNKYYHVLQLVPEQKPKTRALKKERLLTEELDLNTNLFLAVNPLERNGRRIETNLGGITCFFVDLDVDKGYMTPEEAYISIYNDYIQTNKIPMPNIVTFSGNGLHLYWFIEDMSRSFDQMKKWSQITIKIIDKFSRYGSDTHCKDILRVLRIPDTYNLKKGRKRRVYAYELCDTIYTDNIVASYFEEIELSEDEKLFKAAEEIIVKTLREHPIRQENKRKIEEYKALSEQCSQIMQNAPVKLKHCHIGGIEAATRFIGSKEYTRKIKNDCLASIVELEKQTIDIEFQETCRLLYQLKTTISEEEFKSYCDIVAAAYGPFGVDISQIGLDNYEISKFVTPEVVETKESVSVSPAIEKNENTSSTKTTKKKTLRVKEYVEKTHLSKATVIRDNYLADADYRTEETSRLHDEAFESIMNYNYAPTFGLPAKYVNRENVKYKYLHDIAACLILLRDKVAGYREFGLFVFATYLKKCYMKQEQVIHETFKLNQQLYYPLSFSEVVQSACRNNNKEVVYRYSYQRLRDEFHIDTLNEDFNKYLIGFMNHDEKVRREVKAKQFSKAERDKLVKTYAKRLHKEGYTQDQIAVMIAKRFEIKKLTRQTIAKYINSETGDVNVISKFVSVLRCIIDLANNTTEIGTKMEELAEKVKNKKISNRKNWVDVNFLKDYWCNGVWIVRESVSAFDFSWTKPQLLQGALAPPISSG